MSCMQCRGIEELFSQEFVAKELSHYRRKGPDKTTRMLIQAIEKLGVDGLTLLDIGGGVGAVQHALLEAGATQATDVEASTAFLKAAREEDQWLNLSERVAFHFGNFEELAEEIPPADVVTLDRVICCYPNMQAMVDLSAERSRKLYGLVFPRDNWWVKLVLRLGNFWLRIRHSSYRAFVHQTGSVEAILEKYGFRRSYYRKTLVWQVMVYSR
jgi:predicted TPR repeat methyltransferase